MTAVAWVRAPKYVRVQGFMLMLIIALLHSAAAIQGERVCDAACERRSAAARTVPASLQTFQYVCVLVKADVASSAYKWSKWVLELDGSVMSLVPQLGLLIALLEGSDAFNGYDARDRFERAREVVQKCLTDIGRTVGGWRDYLSGWMESLKTPFGSTEVRDGKAARAEAEAQAAKGMAEAGVIGCNVFDVDDTYLNRYNKSMENCQNAENALRDLLKTAASGVGEPSVDLIKPVVERLLGVAHADTKQVPDKAELLFQGLVSFSGNFLQSHHSWKKLQTKLWMH